MQYHFGSTRMAAIFIIDKEISFQQPYDAETSNSRTAEKNYWQSDGMKHVEAILYGVISLA